MWISVVHLTVTTLVESLFVFRNYVQLIFLVSLGISCSGFQANRTLLIRKSKLTITLRALFKM